MRKAIMSGVIIAGLLISVSVTAVFAREPETTLEQEKYDLIIEEVLDQIEKSIDPAIVSEELSMDPAISETPEEEISNDIPVEPESFGEVVEIRETDLNARGARDPVAFDKGPEAGVVELDAIIFVEAGDIDEVVEAGEAEPDASGRLEEMSAFVKETDVVLETGIFALEYIQARDIAVNIGENLTENAGQVQFDEESNSVVVTDTPVTIGKIKELIQGLDLFNVDVLIGARTLKIVLNDEHPEGVDWEAIVSEYQKLALSGEGDGGMGQLSLGTVSQEDYGILLEALDTVGVVHTVFEEDIRTGNETTGTISSLASLRQDEEVRFYLTPMVKKGESLEVAIKMKEAGSEKVTVRMKNGETIVIGGLFEDVMVASTWKIPLLGDLPLLGFVFRNEGEESRKAEIITFLTVKTVEKKKL